MTSPTQMHNVLCRSVTIEARFTASSRSSGSHRDWTHLYRASNSRVRGALWKALYVWCKSFLRCYPLTLVSMIVNMWHLGLTSLVVKGVKKRKTCHFQYCKWNVSTCGITVTILAMDLGFNLTPVVPQLNNNCLNEITSNLRIQDGDLLNRDQAFLFRGIQK
jgi:hypothetical protein